jgi:hypothetical protein
MEAVMKLIVPALVIAVLEVGFVFSIARVPDLVVVADEVVVKVAAQAPAPQAAPRPSRS